MTTAAEARAPARPLSIGLLWHSASAGNLGVGALTVGNIAIVRGVCEELGLVPQFRIMGFVDPEDADYVTGDDVTVVPMKLQTMMPGGAYWRALADTDCVLDIGAGDSFADIYGFKRYLLVWLAKAVALLRGVPLQLSPQTIGPFTRQPQTLMAAMAVAGSDAVLARDPMSFDAARALAPKARVIQTVDVAFALPFVRPKRVKGKTIEVGVNVSGLLFNGGHTGSNEFGMQVDYAAYTRSLIAALMKRPKVQVHLICHVNSAIRPHEDDGQVADLLAKEFPGVVRAPRFSSPSAAKSYISGLDFLVAARMHACIAAYSSGVPVVLVAYSRKFAGLFEGVLGYRHMVPVTGMDADEAVAFTLREFDNRAALSADIAEGSKVVQSLLDVYRAELRRLFSRIKGAAA
jgi:colanic acid/amylovoran biosynthesis protein